MREPAAVIQHSPGNTSTVCLSASQPWAVNSVIHPYQPRLSRKISHNASKTGVAHRRRAVPVGPRSHCLKVPRHSPADAAHWDVVPVCVGCWVLLCSDRDRSWLQVYISGEEMTKYCMDLIREQWVNPYVDTSKWEYFDLSCHGRVRPLHLPLSNHMHTPTLPHHTHTRTHTP